MQQHHRRAVGWAVQGDIQGMTIRNDDQGMIPTTAYIRVFLPGYGPAYLLAFLAH